MLKVSQGYVHKVALYDSRKYGGGMFLWASNTEKSLIYGNLEGIVLCSYQFRVIFHEHISPGIFLMAMKIINFIRV